MHSLLCSARPEWNGWPQCCCLRLCVSQLLMSCASLKPALVSLIMSALRNSGSVLTWLSLCKYGANDPAGSLTTCVFVSPNVRGWICEWILYRWSLLVERIQIHKISASLINEMHQNQLHLCFTDSSSLAAVCLSTSSKMYAVSYTMKRL